MSLKAIAIELGLSLTTVSRALNDYPEVSARTKKKVKAEAERIGYIPNPIARGLALGQANAIGIVFPATVNDLGDVNYLKVLSSMSERFAQQGKDLFIISAHPENELATYERIINAGRVDAFIVPRTKVHDERLEYLYQRKIPFVAHGRSDTFTHPYAWFDMDNDHGAALAAQHLVELGCQSIAYFCANLSYNYIQQRHAAFYHILHQHADINVQQYAIDLDQQSGYLAAQRMLQQSPLADAIFVDNHVAASGVLFALSEAGLKHNQTLKMVIYGTVQNLSPTLTTEIATIQIPEQVNVGDEIANLMLKRLNHHDIHDLQVLHQPVLI